MEDKQNQVKIWNAVGLIPGPWETEEEFFKRASYCQGMKESFKTDFPEIAIEIEGGSYFEEAFTLTKPILSCTPHWPPLLFSNEQLLPWQGGCAWIFESKTLPLRAGNVDDREELLTPSYSDLKDPGLKAQVSRREDENNHCKGAFFQLRKSFKKNARFLGLYERKELIAHEMAHSARLAYHEPKFEEILAYRTSLSSLRKFLGPLFQSTKETLGFVFFLFVIVGLNLFALFDSLALSFLPWTLSVFGFFLAYLLVRLSYRQWKLGRCLRALRQVTESADGLLFRLTDQEILSFGSLAPSAIRSYIQSEPSYRWHFLREVYEIS